MSEMRTGVRCRGCGELPPLHKRGCPTRTKTVGALRRHVAARESACDNPDCLGWELFNSDSEVQRCDDCAIFATDDAALAAAVEWVIEAKYSRGRSALARHERLRIEAVLTIAAERLRGVLR